MKFTVGLQYQSTRIVCRYIRKGNSWSRISIPPNLCQIRNLAPCIWTCNYLQSVPGAPVDGHQRPRPRQVRRPLLLSPLRLREDLQLEVPQGRSVRPIILLFWHLSICKMVIMGRQKKPKFWHYLQIHWLKRIHYRWNTTGAGPPSGRARSSPARSGRRGRRASTAWRARRWTSARSRIKSCSTH